jgi:arylsulfatase A-like enzyme
MKIVGMLCGAALAVLPLSAEVRAQATPPNVIVIMGDDIGWSNIGVYNQGVMSGRTPNLDRLANEGMRFTDLLR